MMFVSLGIGAVVALLLIVVVSVATGGRVTTTTAPSALVGKTIAPFSGQGLHGETIAAPWESGHPSVLIFYASWCTACRAELPRLTAYLHHHQLGAVEVLGVNDLDNPTKARALAKATNFTFPTIRDTGTITQGDFYFSGLPDTVFLTADGHVAAVYSGAITVATFASALATI